MPNRHSDRERWEVYLLQIFLATRPITFAGGLVLFLYAGTAIFVYPVISGVVFVLALILLSMVFSYKVCLYVARFWAWVATLGE